MARGTKGSHFPICAFTNNVGRRSPQRLIARAERWRPFPDAQNTRQRNPRRGGRPTTRAAVAATLGGGAAGRSDGAGSDALEEAVDCFPSSASSRSWAGAGQADKRQTQRSHKT